MIRLSAVCISMPYKIGIVGTRGKGRNHKSLALTGEASHKQAVYDATA
jgi:hypothetical protein